MGFEIKDGRDYLPPEDDIYGVDDIVEESEFNTLLGMKEFSQDARFRKRRNMVIGMAVIMLIVLGIAFAPPALLDMLFK